MIPDNKDVPFGMQPYVNRYPMQLKVLGTLTNVSVDYMTPTGLTKLYCTNIKDSDYVRLVKYPVIVRMYGYYIGLNKDQTLFTIRINDANRTFSTLIDAMTELYLFALKDFLLRKQKCKKDNAPTTFKIGDIVQRNPATWNYGPEDLYAGNSGTVVSASNAAVNQVVSVRWDGKPGVSFGYPHGKLKRVVS